MEHSNYYAYVGTNSIHGSAGIYTLRIDAETLQPEIISTHQAYNAGAVALSGDGRRLYAGTEGMTFRGLADGGLTGYSVEAGRLTEIGAVRTHGQRTCAISIDVQMKNIYCANFYRGTLTMISLDGDGIPQEARLIVRPQYIPPVEPGRPQRKALHCVAAIGERYVAAISTAEMALIIFDAADGRRITSYAFERAHARYVEAVGDYIYALMQDPGDVYVFKNRLEADETIELLQKISCQNEAYKGRFATSSIRTTPDGRLTLVSTRAAGTISVFRRDLENGTLELANVVKLAGECPRDFHISRDGRISVTACQRSNEVLVHEIDYERAALIYRGGCAGIPSPTAVAVSGRE